MSYLLYIERLLVTALLLLLLALAPAMAQDVVYTGETTTLSVEQIGADNYHWELYSDPTVNFAVAAGDPSPTNYAEFVGSDDGPSVQVKWKMPGTYYYKVTALDAAGCAMNLKIGKTIVEKAMNIELSATKIDALCFGEKGTIQFTALNVKEGTYIVKHDHGRFAVDIKADGTGSAAAPAGKYNNLILVSDSYNSYNPNKILSLEITQPNDIVINYSVTPINLHTHSKASISLNVTGGSGNYSYSWDNGATTKDINNLDNGLYTVTVTDSNGCPPKQQTIEIFPPNEPPVAHEDRFTIVCKTASDNVLENDTDPENDLRFISETAVRNPAHGTLKLYADGTFEYKANPLYSGPDSFEYALFDKNKYLGVTATVYLTIIADFDFDGIADDIDKDVDGDGILNEKEAPGKDWQTADEDEDGLPNYRDIDADGDGIVDNYEAQSSSLYKSPVIYDANSNGVNDAYEGLQSGYEINPIDSDEDGLPDFLDPDSDNDGVPDRIEGNDGDSNGKADFGMVGEDSDKDGLDDGYDTVSNECNAPANMTGSRAARQNFDNDDKPDWRDDNDDNDKYLTKFEDMDGNGDFSDDDYDFDGHPEYLDPVRQCEIFIPDAFSPNEPGDGSHDFFQIYCIDQYPNAKLFIFDQIGNKLFEKANYGNEDVWGTEEGAAWWDGKADRGSDRGERVAPGTYYYVLDLGNGEVKKSFVFVSY